MVVLQICDAHRHAQVVADRCGAVVVAAQGGISDGAAARDGEVLMTQLRRSVLVGPAHTTACRSARMDHPEARWTLTRARP